MSHICTLATRADIRSGVGAGCLYFVWAFGDASVKINRVSSRAYFLLISLHRGVVAAKEMFMYRQNFSIRLLAILFVMSSALFVTAGTGKVVEITKGLVYVEIGSLESMKTGDALELTDAAGKLVATLEIQEVYADYFACRPIPAVAVRNIAIGMTVRPKNAEPLKQSVASPTVNEAPTSAVNRVVPLAKAGPSANSEYSSNATPAARQESSYIGTSDSRIPTIVLPAEVNDVVGVGYFGTYTADLLMEQLMLCDKVKLLDRSILGTQMEEADLAGEYIDPATAMKKGKIAGAKYAVKVTMQRPDVVNVSNGIPLASVMGAIGSALGRNIGAQYASNVEIANLKASVSLTARVIDIETGEVLFMTSGQGFAKGKAQVGMEYGALAGAKINNGAEGFKQTVTGKAIQKAFMTVGRSLDAFFNGRTQSRVMGTASGFGRFDEELYRKGMSLYSGMTKLNDEDLQSLWFEHSDLFQQYKAAKKKLRTSNVLNVVGAVAVVGAGILLYAAEGNDADESMYSIGGVACAAVAVAGIVSGTIMNISAHKKVEDVKDRYNRLIRSNNLSVGKRASSSGWSLDLVSSGIVGLRLTF